MKTWRERIAEARERGKFTSDDWDAWTKLDTCPAGECALRYGLGSESQPFYHATLHGIGTLLGDAMSARDFADADQILDLIEDAALRLKRERGA